MTTCDGSSRRSATATRPPHTLAGRIASGPDRRVALLALNVDERDALLDVLEEAERPALTELRGVLADDLAYRRGLGQQVRWSSFAVASPTTPATGTASR